MAKKDKDEEQAPVEGTPDEEQVPVKTYSQEEVDALRETAQEEAKQAEFIRMNTLLTQKGAEISRLEEQQAQPPKVTDDDLAQIFIDERKGKVSEYGETDLLIPKLEAVVAKRKQAQEQARMATFTRRADVAYKQAEEVYGEDDVDNLHAIRTLIRAGDFDLAEKKIAKAMQKKEPEEKKQEAELKDDTFISEEAKRKWMEEHGLLESETGGPSGAGKRTFTEDQIADRVFYEANRGDILKAYEEGRIKKIN